FRCVGAPGGLRPRAALGDRARGARVSRDVQQRRLTAQLLAGEAAPTAEDAVRRILAVQGQDPRGFRLAVRPRTSGVTAADVVAGRTEGQALVHLLFAASLRHRVVRGPVQDGEHAYVLADTWLGPAPEPLDRRDALTELARRYLAGHGPAGPRDLAVWAGM